MTMLQWQSSASWENEEDFLLLLKIKTSKVCQLKLNPTELSV